MIFPIELALAALVAIPVNHPAIRIEIVCGPRAALLATLDRRYHEKLVAGGLSHTSTVVEITVNSKGDWTMFRTNTMGISCVIDTGEHWTNFEVSGERS